MSLHEYSFRVTSVHDGDTLEGDLDLGFYINLQKVALRIHGINAPELVQTVSGHRTLVQAGEDATLHLMTLLGGRSLFAAKRLNATFGIPGAYLVNPGAEIDLVVRTRLVDGDTDSDKYGRVLGEAYLGISDDPYGLNIGAQMLADGFAVAM